MTLADPTYADRYEHDPENLPKVIRDPGSAACWIVVTTRSDSTIDGALSRRLDHVDHVGAPGDEKFTGPWGLLTEAEAHELADTWNDDPREGSHAHVVEVFRFDQDPVWTEEYA